jgi:hypothetical protein
MPQPSLTERIAALREEIDLAIDQFAAKEAKTNPGVPEVSIRQMITKGSACQCRAYLIHTGEIR